MLSLYFSMKTSLVIFEIIISLQNPKRGNLSGEFIESMTPKGLKSWVYLFLFFNKNVRLLMHRSPQLKLPLNVF